MSERKAAPRGIITAADLAAVRRALAKANLDVHVREALEGLEELSQRPKKLRASEIRSIVTRVRTLLIQASWPKPGDWRDYLSDEGRDLVEAYQHGHEWSWSMEHMLLMALEELVALREEVAELRPPEDLEDEPNAWDYYNDIGDVET